MHSRSICEKCYRTTFNLPKPKYVWTILVGSHPCTARKRKALQTMLPNRLQYSDIRMDNEEDPPEDCLYRLEQMMAAQDD